MSSQTITHHHVPESLLSKIWEDLEPNYAALFAVAVVVFIWVELSPIWLPCVSWLISFLAPAFWFLCEMFAALAGVFLLGFGLVAVALLLSGAVPRSHY